MKKMLSVLLCICILLSGTVLAVTADENTIMEVVAALEIMQGDENGDMNLDKPVTRAEFTKLMVAASSYKDSVTTGYGFSLFKDVKSNHWASGYISTAIDAKWMTGYVDGTFRPDATITYEEGASAVLRMLGFTASDLSGAYPHAHIRKFESLKLNSGISPEMGRILTRRECMYIFYNLMGAAMKTGGLYGTSLGYTLNADGEIDYDVHVKGDIEGPFVMQGAQLSAVVPFNLKDASVYRNNSLSAASAVGRYDVVYYNESMKTVWAYSNRAIGKLTAVAPNAVTPSSVTVGGNTYTLETTEAKEKASVTGGYAIGDTVALLLGMNGTVVDILPSSEADGVFYGVVTNFALVTYEQNSSGSLAEYILTVACTDGITRECAVSGNNNGVGSIVTVSYAKGEITVTGTGGSNMSGTFTSDGKRLSTHPLSSDVQIMDVSSDGSFTLVDSSRMSGAALEQGQVRFHKLNSNNEISHLILNDVTGDLHTYAIITSAQENIGGSSASSSYSYITDGRTGTFGSSNTVFNVSVGPAIFYYKSGQISAMRNIPTVQLTELTALSAAGGSRKFKLADNVQVYVKSGNSYSATTLAAVNTVDYTLTGCYETLFPAGGVIRIIIAVRK